MKENKLAVFDFCETIVNFQSADAFINYYLSKEKGKTYYRKLWVIIRSLRLRRLFNKLSPRLTIDKLLYLKQLKGCEREKLESLAKDYYEEVIKPGLIAETITELKKVQDDGWKVIVVSGGFDIYIKYFAEEYGIDLFVAGELEFKNGKFTGTLKEKDCMYEEKIIYTKRLLRVSNISDEYKNSRLYSDSETDKPLFMQCNERVAVLNKNRYNSVAPKWVDEIGASVIWHD